MNNGADINVQNWKGATALSLGAAKGRMHVVELLLNNGADVNVRDEKGRMALHWAASGGHRHIAELLLRNGADSGVKCAQGSTVLDLASGNGHQHVVELLSINAIRGGEVDWLLKGSDWPSGRHKIDLFQAQAERFWRLQYNRVAGSTTM